MFDSKFIRYLLTSGFSAGVNFASRFLFSLFLPYSSAVACAYFTGMLVNFSLTTRLVFGRYENSRLLYMFLKFTTVAVVGLVVTVAVSVAVRSLLLALQAPASLEFIELFAHLTGIGVCFIVSFLGHKLFTYRHTGLLSNILGGFKK